MASPTKLRDRLALVEDRQRPLGRVVEDVAGSRCPGRGTSWTARSRACTACSSGTRPWRWSCRSPGPSSGRRRRTRPTSRPASGRGRRPVLILGVRPNSPCHDQHVVLQAAVVQVLHQGRHGLVELRQQLVFSCLKLFAVRVPAAAGLDGHERHARSTSRRASRQLWPEVVAAVAVAELGRLLVDVERRLAPCVSVTISSASR